MWGAFAEDIVLYGSAGSVPFGDRLGATPLVCLRP